MLQPISCLWSFDGAEYGQRCVSANQSRTPRLVWTRGLLQLRQTHRRRRARDHNDNDGQQLKRSTIPFITVRTSIGAVL